MANKSKVNKYLSSESLSNWTGSEKEYTSLSALDFYVIDLEIDGLATEPGSEVT